MTDTEGLVERLQIEAADAERELAKSKEEQEQTANRAWEYLEELAAVKVERDKCREALKEIKGTYCEARDYKAGRSLPLVQQIDAIVNTALTGKEGE